MSEDKLWINCSPQEKRAVKRIEREKGWYDYFYSKGYISRNRWLEEKELLIKQLDEIEKKYSD